MYVCEKCLRDDLDVVYISAYDEDCMCQSCHDKELEKGEEK